MKIIVEDKIPGLKGVFEPFSDVSYLPASEITRERLKDADALITRTRPYIGEEILDGSGIKIIATATIGTDHIDTDYCSRAGIKVVNAPGCNAPAVAQWVCASIFTIIGNIADSEPVLGVVGVGNVGSIVSRWGRNLGFRVLENDPPRAVNELSGSFVGLDTIVREADIITFHTPLTKSGSNPTYHLADSSFFNMLEKKPVILNAARGAVIDTSALVKAIDRGYVSSAAIDCWEGEPDISCDLLLRAEIATPHIAGYSWEGKMRASATVIRAVADELDIPVKIPFDVPEFEHERMVTREMIMNSYDPSLDTYRLKQNPSSFEFMRDTYLLRSEP